MNEVKKTPKSARAQFIFATIFLDALGIGLIIPTMPDIIRRFGTDPAFVSQYFGYFISVYALMQFLMSPVLGSLSDRFGRRSILLVSLLFAGLDYILMAYAPTLGILFVGRVLSGLTGASMTVATAYMADVSDDSNRAANFGLIGAGFGMGFVAGPILGGLLGAYTPHAPFLAAAALNLLNFIFGIFVLPESLPESSRRKFDLKRLNPFKSMLIAVRPSSILLMVWVYILVFFAGNVHPAVWTLYTQYKFGWSAWQVGLSLTFVGIVIAIAQGWLTRIIIPRLGEYRSIVVGLAVGGIALCLWSVANQGWMMYAIMAFASIGGIGGPALQSELAKEAPPSQQGELQGTLVSLGSLTAIISPLFYTTLFTEFTRPDGVIFSGAPYLAAGAIQLFGLLMLFAAHRLKTPSRNAVTLG